MLLFLLKILQDKYELFLGYHLSFHQLPKLEQFEIKPATKMVNFKVLKKEDYLEMVAYSIDLRQKILSAWQNKEGTQRELAKRFKASLSFLRDFLRRYRETGQIAARTQGGERRSKLKGKEEELLKIIVTEQSDICLREIQEEIKERKGIEVVYQVCPARLTASN